jgi:6-phosphogluconolactonase (cycloisomerase 2 family)
LLYANNTLGTDSIYAMQATPNGQLNLIENQITNPLFAVGLTTTNDGNFLYGAGGISGGGNAVFGYSISATGSLDALSPFTFASPGSSPKVLAFTDDDRVMVAGHGTDATFWSFLRDTTTGNLTATSHMFDVGLQGTLGDLQIMGDLLFVTDESTALDGITGIYSFRINPDGSFTQLGPIQDTLGARPEYIATWVGVPEPTCGIWLAIVLLSCARKNRGRRPEA